MDISLKDNLRKEFQEILERKQFEEKIKLQKLDLNLLQSAFDVLLEKENDEQATAFINNIINTLNSKNIR